MNRFHVLDRRLLRQGGLASLTEWRRFMGEIRAQRYDVALDFHGRFKSGIVTRGSGARLRLGYPRGQCTEANWIFTNVHVRLNDPLENRVQRFLHLLGPLGVNTDASVDDLGIDIPSAERDRAESWYETAGRPELAVYPGTSANQAAYHRWPAERWVALLQRLGHAGLRSVVFWGPDDADLARGIAAEAGDACVLAPKTSLVEMMAMVGRFRLFIGSNTAAAHMAWMQHVPTVMFSGPAEPRTDAPLPPIPSRVLRAGDRVRRGVSKRRQPDVVAAVTVEETLAAAQELWEEVCQSNPPIPRAYSNPRT